jgi:hypothetical protein
VIHPVTRRDLYLFAYMAVVVLLAALAHGVGA